MLIHTYQTNHLLSRDILGRLQLGYEHLPKWLQQGVISWNKGSLDLENGSSILVNIHIESSAIRGGSYNIIFLMSLSYVPSTVSEEFFSSVYPTISSGKTTNNDSIYTTWYEYVL